MMQIFLFGCVCNLSIYFAKNFETSKVFRPIGTNKVKNLFILSQVQCMYVAKNLRSQMMFQNNHLSCNRLGFFFAISKNPNENKRREVIAAITKLRHNSSILHVNVTQPCDRGKTKTFEKVFSYAFFHNSMKCKY